MKAKTGTIIDYAWMKSLRKISPEAAWNIIDALVTLDFTGDMPNFEEGSIEDILFAGYAPKVIERNQNYEEERQRRSAAAKKREAEKAQRSTTVHNEAQETTTVDDMNRCDVISNDVMCSDVIGDDVMCSEEITDSAPNSSQEFNDAVMQAWNSQECTLDIDSIAPLSIRENQIRLCLWRIERSCSEVEPKRALLNVIKHLDQQEWFAEEAKRGNLRKFDWFINPDNFQKVVEGNYKNLRTKGPAHGEGWE